MRPCVSSSHFADLNASDSMLGGLVTGMFHLVSGNKKAAPKDGLRGGRICTYVSSIKGTPRTVLLSALPIFPYVRHPINHGPLVRRKTCCALRRIGIIPAYAGNTCSSRSSCMPGWDHPRVCGEHQWRNCYASRGEGSSPRMRGTRSLCKDTSRYCRIIPAYAGNTKFF